MSNKVLISLLVLSPLLCLSCKGEKWSLEFALEEYVKHVKDNLLYPVELSSKDSGYWVGTCWNLYQLTKDSIFYIQAKRCSLSMLPIWKYAHPDAEKVFQLYLAFGRGFDASKEPHYKHEVWNLADCLMEDSVKITDKTVEVLLWATANKGCHCFKEAAIRWGTRQQTSAFTIEDMQAFTSMYMYTDSLSYLNTILSINEKSLLRSSSDSILIASAYSRIANRTGCKDLQGKAVDILTRFDALLGLTLENSYYYTVAMLELIENEKRKNEVVSSQ